MFDHLLLVAVTDTIWTRLAVCAALSVFGAFMIFVGRYNILAQTAEESLKGRLVNTALGRSNTYHGSKAVRLGWTRVICGIGCIIFGILSLFVGPFLAE